MKPIKKKKKKLKKETSVTGNVAGFALPLGVYDVRKDPNVIKRSKKKAAQNAIGRSKSEPKGWNYLESKGMTLRNSLREEIFTKKTHSNLLSNREIIMTITRKQIRQLVEAELLKKEMKTLNEAGKSDLEILQMLDNMEMQIEDLIPWYKDAKIKYKLKEAEIAIHEAHKLIENQWNRK